MLKTITLQGFVNGTALGCSGAVAAAFLTVNTNNADLLTVVTCDVAGQTLLLSALGTSPAKVIPEGAFEVADADGVSFAVKSGSASGVTVTLDVKETDESGSVSPSYCTCDDVVTSYGAARIRGLLSDEDYTPPAVITCDQTLRFLVERANAQVNMYLSGTYSDPGSNPPKNICGIACQIVNHLLRLRRQETMSDADEKSYEQLLDELKMIASTGYRVEAIPGDTSTYGGAVALPVVVDRDQRISKNFT